MNFFSKSDFALRDMCREDGDMVLAWRNDERVRKNMYNDHIIDTGEHTAWLERVMASKADSYLIFNYRHQPVGLVSFHRIDCKNDKAMWAFYLGETDVPKGIGSVMEFFALSRAFGELGLRKLSCEVIEFNASVVKLHRRFGFEQEGFFVEEIERDGRFWGVHRLALFRNGWERIAPEKSAQLFKE